MNYYIDTRSRDHEELRISGVKGHVDFYTILGIMGMECISIPSIRQSDRITVAGRIRMEARLRRMWRKALEHLGKDDILVLHSPPSEKFLGLPQILNELKRRGCRVITVIFDPEQFYMPSYTRAAWLKHRMDAYMERKIFDASDVVAAHTEIMKDMLIERGISSKISTVGIWDYLIDEPLKEDAIQGRVRLDAPVVFCGNLSQNKSGFVYRLAEEHDIEDFSLDLYGPYYTGSSGTKVRHRGVYKADELLEVITGSFGLVWDGPAIDSCIGTYGEYLRYNIPHKLSMYLASGMPVLIWKEAALAEFVREERCGLEISGIEEIPSLLSSITEEEYDELCTNARRVGADLRQGVHIRAAVEKALDMLGQA